jgi:hypothetical protein
MGEHGSYTILLGGIVIACPPLSLEEGGLQGMESSMRSMGATGLEETYATRPLKARNPRVVYVKGGAL